MRPHWLVWVAFAFIIGQMMCLISQGIWLGSEEQDFFNALLGFTAHEYTDSLIGNIGTTFVNVIGGLVGFFTVAIPKLVMWDYSFLDGGWSIVKWLLLYPLSAGTVIGVVSLFKR